MRNFQLENFEEIRNAFGAVLVDKALGVTLDQSIKMTRTRIGREVRKVYNVKVKDVKSALKPIKATYTPPQRLLMYAAKRISLARFGAKAVTVKSRMGKRRGVSVRVKKGGRKKIVRGKSGFGGFLGTGKLNGHIYMRTSRKRFPIEKRSGPAIPQLVGTSKTMKAAFDFIEKDVPKRFEHNMNFFINKSRKRK